MLRSRCAARHQVVDENGNMVYVESVMCHQCQRNGKGHVVRCTKCQTKRYYHPCMNTWYPNMTHEMFAQCCPVCQNNCNYKGCLRDVLPKAQTLEKMRALVERDMKVQPDGKVERQVQEHIQERVLEASAREKARDREREWQQKMNDITSVLKQFTNSRPPP